MSPAANPLLLTRARELAHKAPSGGATERICRSCQGKGIAHVACANSPKGFDKHDPCFNCAGYGVTFQVRETSWNRSVPELLAELEGQPPLVSGAA